MKSRQRLWLSWVFKTPPTNSGVHLYASLPDLPYSVSGDCSGGVRFAGCGFRSLDTAPPQTREAAECVIIAENTFGYGDKGWVVIRGEW
jgi:hypothetical protein